nr:hypothetical protein Hi04_10k_c3996_00015 [uncultured bacterium]
MGDRDVTVTVARHCYSMYGVRVTSDIPFAFADAWESDAVRSLAEVTVVDADGGDFTSFAAVRMNGGQFLFDEAADGTAYLRWPRLYEFALAPDGSRIACRPLDGCDVSVLQNFLFGQVLALALVRQGIEPLHAAAVVLDCSAVAFLGDCTYGKSTLLASFTEAGYRAITDDMLILDRRGGDLRAMAGSGRVKLQPDSARLFFDRGDGAPLTPFTQKRSFAIDRSMRQGGSVPLQLLYVLPTPAERDVIRSIDIRPMSRAAAVRELVANTFTTHIVSRERLARQFEHATSVASRVDTFELRYPTGLDHLPAIRRAIVEHSRQWIARPTPTTESL